jgi:3-hydroxyacyl-[acyl-carrier-protein] dehydratase
MKFRLVDKITSWAPYQHINGIKTVSFEEYCLKAAFGDEPRLPELLVLESFLQLGNWLLMLSSDFQQMGMVARISKAQFHSSLLPGQSLCLEARLVRRRQDAFELAGQGQVDSQTVISGLGCLALSVPLAEYLDPADMRVLFSEIYDPGPPPSLPVGSKSINCVGKDAGTPGAAGLPRR